MKKQRQQIELKNKTDIFGDGISYIAEVDMSESNRNEENRIHFSQLATISRKKLSSNNPDVLFNRLKKEANTNAPSRPVEFIPIKLKVSVYDNKFYLRDPNTFHIINDNGMSFDLFINNIAKFSYIESGDGGNALYTNLRCLINAGMHYNSIPYNDNTSQFKCIVAKIPYFVYSHLVTHTQLSKEASSIRIQKKLAEEYWYPTMTNDSDTLLVKNKFKDLEQIVESKVSELQEMQVRPEISYRELSQRRYIECVICGWENNIHGWANLLEERGAGEWKTWTQEPTKKTVKLIKQLLYER